MHSASLVGVHNEGKGRISSSDLSIQVTLRMNNLIIGSYAREQSMPSVISFPDADDMSY